MCCAGEDADDAGDEILGRQDSWDGRAEAEEHKQEGKDQYIIQSRQLLNPTRVKWSRFFARVDGTLPALELVPSMISL